MSNLGAFSMWDLFRGEVESQMRAFTEGLLALEGGSSAKEHLAATMRAAHSIKGAARIVQLDVAVTLSHAMEDCLVAAQEGALTLDPGAIDVLLSAGDLLAKVSALDESGVPAWVEEQTPAIDKLLSQLADVRAGKSVAPAPAAPQPVPVPPPAIEKPPAPVPEAPAKPIAQEPAPAPQAPAAQSAPAAPARAQRSGTSTDRGIRVTAQILNRLMGLAGESLVQSRWFEPFSETLLDLKRRHKEINDHLDVLRSYVENSPEGAATLDAAQRKLQETRRWSAEQQAKLDAFGIRSAGLSDRLYREVVASRMRPFGDGIEGFPRLVRDLARQLGKQVHLEVVGANTEIDREILDRLEAPLNHAIRNSLDHGIELPADRFAAGKSPTGTIRLEARHRAGLFVLTVSDDGRGVDIEMLRTLVATRGLATVEMAPNCWNFCFFPVFPPRKLSPIFRAGALGWTPCRKWPNPWAAWPRSRRDSAWG
jgi:two-component system sensor histidine kinase and response regulator WspE